ncbi:sensor histidine kinase [Halobacillus amylolyticus]|uniref:histidine kinase n=1 Tax=Halobacillus amylolyticus TaxID=2932259 RepID=A0ABY4HGY5_9BACI|nr:HAMP domain-containing sensor histidine kinase [Halobacillus amylolyticus]UOR13816.1 HAMP domain-containing histidine kinase [Halobacillus amylolyticus]
MSIRKRLILSNIAMVIVPILLLLIVEIATGYLLMNVFEIGNREELQKIFISVQFVGLFLILILTNGIITYFVSKSILRPINRLSHAAEEIGKGNLNFTIERMRKDEIGKLSDTFEMMRKELLQSQELQQKYEENRKKLIKNLSHDLKTPITSIKDHVEGLRDGVADTEEKKDAYMGTIHTKTIVMDRLIDELLEQSRLDMGKFAFRFKEVDLRPFLIDTMEEFQLEWEEVSFSFQSEEGKRFRAQADLDQLRRVVVNILNNSLKHMDKADKKIDIQLMKQLGEITVEIKDNGPGILDQDLPHIFEMFYRSDLARRQEGGSGLGLAVSKRIIEEHEGEITAASRKGHGTTIKFTLPDYRD